MGGRRTQSSSPDAPITVGNSLIGDDAYSQIMGQRQFQSVLDSIQASRSRAVAGAAETQTSDGFESLPFSRDSLQRSVDQGLSSVQSHDGSAIPIYDAFKMAGINGMQSSGTNAQMEQAQTDALNPFVGNSFQTQISPDWTYSRAFAQGAEGIHHLGEEMLNGFYKGIQQTFYGSGADAPGLSRHEAPYAYAAMDSVSGLGSGLLGLASSAFKVLEDPLHSPQTVADTFKGLVTSVNPFEPGIEPADRFGRSINLALVFAAGLEGAGKLRDASLASNLRHLGLDKAEAYGIVKNAREGLAMLDKETGGAAPFVEPLRDILKGDRIKSAVADYAEMSKGMGDEFLSTPNIASRIGDRINPFKGRNEPDVAVSGAGASSVPVGKVQPDLPQSGGAVVTSGTSQVAAPREILPGLGRDSETGRIMPAPLNDGAPVKSIEDITSKLYEDLTMKGSRQGKTGHDAGFYDVDQATTVTRAFNDLSNEPHELGHFLNEQYDLVTAWDKPRAKSPYDAELDSLWEGRNTDNMTLARRREEGVAEFVRAYVINPDEALAKAPEFFKHFEATVPEGVRTALRNAGDDIRRYVGQDATQLVQNQIVDRVGTPSLLQRLQAGIEGVKANIGARDIDPTKPFVQAGIDKFRHNWIDNLAPLQAAMEYVRKVKGDKPLPQNDPVILANKLRYTKNAVSETILTGIRDHEGNYVTDGSGQPLSISHILEPLQGEEEFRAMLAYGVSERVVTEAARVRQAAIDEATGLREQAKELRGKGELKDAEKLEAKAERLIKKSYLDTQSLTNAGAGFYDSASVHAAQMHELAKNPELLGRVQESLRRYRAFSDALMQYANDRGLISDEHLVNLRAKGDSYFDLGRVMDEASDRLGLPREHRSTVETMRRSGGSVRKAIEGKFKGSTRLINSPVIELMSNAARIVELGERNQMLNAIVEPMRDTTGLSAQAKNLLSSVAERVQTGETGADTITMLVNGEKETWKLEPELAKMLKESDDAGILEPAMKWLGLGAKILRWGVTSVPSYLIRNFAKDYADKSIKGTSGMNPIDSLKNIKSSDFDSWYNYVGGGMSLLEEPTTKLGFEQMQRRLLQSEGALSKTSRTYKEFRETLERANRMVEYKAEYKRAYKEYIDQGLTHEQANYNAHLRAGEAARQLIDFARSGRYTRQINRVVAFTNASVQSVATTAKAFQLRPGASIAKTFMVLGLPTIVEQWYARNIGDTQEEKDKNWREYNELPAYQRDMFFNYLVPGFGFVRIPKPYEIGVFVSMFPRMASGNWDGYFSDKGQILEGSLEKAFMPLRITDTSAGLFKTAQELQSGYDSFRGNYYVPPDQNNAALALRDQSNASGIGKLLGGITNVDARKVDHAIQGTLGNFGGDVLTLTKGNMTGAQAMKLLFGITTDVASYGAADVSWCLWKAEQAKAGNPFSEEFKSMKALRQNQTLDPVAKAQALAQVRLAMLNHAIQLRKNVEQVEQRPFTDEKQRWTAVQGVLK